MRIKKPALMALAPLLLATALPAFAQNRDGSWELGPFITSNYFDDDIEIEDETGGGFRFGINFTAMHELEFSFDHVETQDNVVNTIDVDVKQFQVNYVFNMIFDRHQPVVPYLTAGLGSVRFEVGETFFFFGPDRETDTLFSLGGGVRFFLGKIFNIRLDARKIYFEGDGVVLAQQDYENTQLSACVGWVVGGH